MLASEKKRYDELRLRLCSNSMLNMEEFKELRYLGLRLRLYSNSMLNVEEYSEFLQLHTQFQDSKKDIYAQPTVSTEQSNQRDVEKNVVNDNVAIIVINL